MKTNKKVLSCDFLANPVAKWLRKFAAGITLVAGCLVSAQASAAVNYLLIHGQPGGISLSITSNCPSGYGVHTYGTNEIFGTNTALMYPYGNLHVGVFTTNICVMGVPSSINITALPSQVATPAGCVGGLAQSPSASITLAGPATILNACSFVQLLLPDNFTFAMDYAASLYGSGIIGTNVNLAPASQASCSINGAANPFIFCQGGGAGYSATSYVSGSLNSTIGYAYAIGY